MDELIERMRHVTDEQPGMLRDAESWHADADDLLVEAIRLLGKGADGIEEFIAAYDAIDKWYA